MILAQLYLTTTMMPTTSAAGDWTGTCRDAFYSGFLLARSKRSRLDVDSLDLLAYQEGGTSGVIYPSSDGAVPTRQEGSSGLDT